VASVYLVGCVAYSNFLIKYKHFNSASKFYMISTNNYNFWSSFLRITSNPSNISVIEWQRNIEVEICKKRWIKKETSIGHSNQVPLPDDGFYFFFFFSLNFYLLLCDEQQNINQPHQYYYFVEASARPTKKLILLMDPQHRRPFMCERDWGSLLNGPSIAPAKLIIYPTPLKTSFRQSGLGGR